MTYAAPLPFTPDQLRAIATAMRGWLFALAGWLLDVFGEQSRIGRALRVSLRADLSIAAKELKIVVLLLAHARIRHELVAAPRLSGARPPVPHGPPRGVRVRHPWQARRVFLRGVLPRGGTLRQRITILLRTLRRLDACADRLIARWKRGPHGAALIAFAPLMRLLSGRALAPAGRDTS